MTPRELSFHTDFFEKFVSCASGPYQSIFINLGDGRIFFALLSHQRQHFGQCHIRKNSRLKGQTQWPWFARHNGRGMGHVLWINVYFDFNPLAIRDLLKLR